jgi:hypothetical protein
MKAVIDTALIHRPFLATIPPVGPSCLYRGRGKEPTIILVNISGPLRRSSDPET